MIKSRGPPPPHRSFTFVILFLCSCRSIMTAFDAVQVTGSHQNVFTLRVSPLLSSDLVVTTFDEILRLVLPSLSIFSSGWQVLEAETFYSLGGDSVGAIELMWRVRQELNVDIAPAMLLLPLPRLAADLNALVDVSAANAVDSNTINSEPSRKKKRSTSIVSPTEHLYQQSTMIMHGSPCFWAGRSGYGHREATKSASAIMASSVSITKAWSVKLKRCVDSSPLVTAVDAVDNVTTTVYIGSHGGDFLALDATNGTILWQEQLGEHIEGGTACNSSGSIIYVTSFCGKDRESNDDSDFNHLGSLWALRSLEATDDTSRILWVTRMAGEVKGAASIDHSSNLVVVGSHDGCIYFVSSIDGSETYPKVNCGGGSIFASPLIDELNRRVFAVTTQGVLMCLTLPNSSSSSSSHITSSMSPTTLWSVDFGAPIFTSPIFYNNSIIIGGVDGSVRAIQSQTGESVWQSFDGTKPIFSSPCHLSLFLDGVNIDVVVFGCHDGYLRCVLLSTGCLLWDVDLGSAIFSAPTFVPDSNLILASTTAGEIIVIMGNLDKKDQSMEGSDEGRWRIKAKFRMPAEIYSSPVFYKGKIYIGCRDDNIYVFEILYE